MIDFDNIKRAKAGATLRTFQADKAAAELLNVVHKVAAIKGEKMEKGAAEVCATALYEQLMQRFPAITTAEIWLAISEALYSGKRVFRTNAVDLFICVSDYVNSDEHRRYIAEEARIRAARTPQLAAHIPTQEETDRHAKEMVLMDFNSFKTLGTLAEPFFITPRGTFVYDYLERLGRIRQGAWLGYKDKPMPVAVSIWGKALDGTLSEEITSKFKCYYAYMEHITRTTLNTQQQ